MKPVGVSDQLLLDLLKITLTRVEPSMGLAYLRGIRSATGGPEDMRASEQVGRVRAALDWLPSRAKMMLWLLIGLVPESSRWRQQLRIVGRDLPGDADTMVGLGRLENVERLALDVLSRGVPGDFLEAGVWRGGTAMLMRAIQIVAGDEERRVWLADSFEGLPAPAAGVPADRGSPFHRVRALAVPESEVRRRFETYGLLDERVDFIRGWFAESLPGTGVSSIALLRIDADMYGSTMDALTHLYHRVSRGGFVIIDDYGAIPECRAAVDDFRRANAITEPMIPVDFTGSYWRVAA